MTKFYFLRKNVIIHCREAGTKKGGISRTWYKAKICADGWQPFDIHTESLSAQFEKELRNGKLTLIPEKYFEKNREGWKEEPVVVAEKAVENPPPVVEPAKPTRKTKRK